VTHRPVRTLVSVVFASYRDPHLLVRAIPPVLAARTCDVEVVVVNNEPDHDVSAMLGPLAGESVRIIEMGGNRGYCGAYNRGIAESRSEFVFLANPDLFVADDYVDELVAFFHRRPRAACANGKILRYDLVEDRPTELLDTAGLSIGRNRRGMDRGEGSDDEGSFEVEEQVFAANGAAFFARRRALEDVAVDGEIFDESFFMYKEDLDLCWRLRLAGWECWYVPTAHAYHARSSRGLGSLSYRSSPLAFHRQQRLKPPLSRTNSMRNQWLMLVKNEDLSNLVRDLPHIALRELGVVVWTILFSPRTLVAVPEFGRLLRRALAKRRLIKQRQVVPAAAMREWFGRA
jgi:GT2 family glycosyltransferase